jgi:hypothetical protein
VKNREVVAGVFLHLKALATALAVDVMGRVVLVFMEYPAVNAHLWSAVWAALGRGAGALAFGQGLQVADALANAVTVVSQSLAMG